MCQFSKQQFVSQCRADRILDQSGHGSGTHERVEAIFCQIGFECFGESHFDFLLVKLFFQLHEELFNHAQNHFQIQWLERNGGIEAIAELWCEDPLDFLEFVAHLLLGSEAHHGLVQRFLASISGQNDHHIAEVGFASIVVSQCAVIHHLQQHVVDVLMRFLDFVEQQDAIWLFVDGFGEQATLFETHVTRWGTDQT